LRDIRGSRVALAIGARQAPWCQRLLLRLRAQTGGSME
jgi:hypothetical protein